MKFPCAFPSNIAGTLNIVDGYQVETSRFCGERLQRGDSACARHYVRMAQTLPGEFVMCPYGFTSYRVPLDSGDVVLTGVVGAPRFGDDKERERAKVFPSHRVARSAIVDQANTLVAMEIEWHRIQEETRRKLPQALHELRKLNAIVKQGAERLTANQANVDDAENVAGAAQLMSNIFEIVEALTNIEDIRIAVSQRLEFIAVFDLAYKAKKIYGVRAKLKPIHIRVSGDDSVGVLGSKKYFPLILQVLLENAIKYGVKDSLIEIGIVREHSSCVISVKNETDREFDAVRCFERGRRYADPDSEGDGLGLYLAKEVVLAHGGSIECDSTTNAVIFRVKVPAHFDKRR